MKDPEKMERGCTSFSKGLLRAKTWRVPLTTPWELDEKVLGGVVVRVNVSMSSGLILWMVTLELPYSFLSSRIGLLGPLVAKSVSSLMAINAKCSAVVDVPECLTANTIFHRLHIAFSDNVCKLFDVIGIDSFRSISAPYTLETISLKNS
jgi:hypothetical protein